MIKVREGGDHEMSMYEILIVDDEPVEREVIRFLLKKFELPFHVTEAVNGQQALELLAKRHFHILFTDIKMPFVDGLELARQARDLFPDLHIVFFSGYDDFETARQAFSLGVVNYILKPVNPEEFRKTLTGILERLRERESSARREVSVRGAVRRSALLQLVNGVTPERLRQMYLQWDFGFLEEYHRMLMIRLDRNIQNDVEIYLPWEELQQLLPEESQCVTLKPGSGLILFGGRKHQRRWYQELAVQMAGCVQTVTGVACFIEVSHSFDGPQEIHKVYTELKKALGDKVFFASNTPAGSNARTDGPDSDEVLLKRLETDIRLKDARGLRKHMAALLDACRMKPRSSGQIRYLCTKTVTVLLDSLPGDSGTTFDHASRTIQESQFSTIEQLLLELTEQVAGELEKAQQFQSHGVLLAKQYVHQHFGEGLSLNVIAEKVHLSPRYLSALFVEEEGVGINRYIKKVRMQKACELLLGTNMKVSEICTMVGYSNLSYFCKSFQEDFGMTPDKFRSLPPGELPVGKGTADDS